VVGLGRPSRFAGTADPWDDSPKSSLGALIVVCLSSPPRWTEVDHLSGIHRARRLMTKLTDERDMET
jgi:hypothetical protein